MNGVSVTEHPRDNRFVVGGSRLLSADVCEALRSSEAVGAVIRAMHNREADVRRQLEGVSAAIIRAACQRSIARFAPGTGVDDLCIAGEGAMDSASFAHAVYALPRTLSKAGQRKAARELARALALVDGPGITVPASAPGFQRLWEEANDGEPRLSDDFPLIGVSHAAQCDYHLPVHAGGHAGVHASR